MHPETDNHHESTALPVTPCFRQWARDKLVRYKIPKLVFLDRSVKEYACNIYDTSHRSCQINVRLNDKNYNRLIYISSALFRNNFTYYLINNLKNLMFKEFIDNNS